MNFLVRVSLFWRLGLTYLALVLAVFTGVYWFERDRCFLGRCGGGDGIRCGLPHSAFWSSRLRSPSRSLSCFPRGSTG